MKFLRTDYMRLSKLGKNRKKLQVWRSAKGRHSKIRKKRKGYPSMPLIGRRGPRKDSGKVKGMIPVLVHNTKDLESLNKQSLIIIAKVGAKKRLDIIKNAQEKQIQIMNLGKSK